MSDLPPRYLATMNTPGHLPWSDDRMLFDTVQAAWEYLAGERERQEDADTEECEYSDTLLTLRYISSGELSRPASVQPSRPRHRVDRHPASRDHSRSAQCSEHTRYEARHHGGKPLGR